ncbi:MAG: hypothetical protein QOJ83_2786 [Frankiales bacterium]|nr:hypothetical protein [Frankiales bacterium]
MRIRIAWTLVVVSVVCAVLDTVITAEHAPLLSEQVWARHGWPLVSLATLGSALMGALIVSRYPRHPIGWLLVVAGVSSISVMAEAYSLWPPVGAGHTALIAGHVAGWVSALLGAPLAMTAVIVIFLIAPDGRLLSRRWRWAARTAVLGFALYTAAVLSQSPTAYDIGQRDLPTATQVVVSIGITLMILSLVASVVGLVLRLARTQGETRRQLLWVAASAAMLATTFVWLLVTQQVNGGEDSLASATPIYAAYLSVPICTAVAVLRHRLFDIDLIVNRALVVFLATAVVSGAYVLLVVVLGSALGGDKGYWPSLLATAVVALAFQPLRRRVVRVADRLAFGAAAEPYDALADFTRRLGESPDPSELLPAVAEAAANAVSARRVTVELALPFRAAETATWPAGAVAGAGPTASIPVADDSELLGSLVVEMAPGHALRGKDTALLRDLADQAVIAFRNARLSAELSHRVEELDLQTRALEESRRRLITAGDAERRRLERAVTRDVARHLQLMPAQLDELARGTVGPVTAELVQPLRAQAEAALEALREITRGVYPVQLGRSGLEPALRSLLGRTGGTTLHVDAGTGLPRSEARVEAAAYFCVAEAVRDLGGPVEVSLARREESLVVVIDGQDASELPLANMRDRAEALGGTISSRRAEGRHSLEVRLPAPVAAGIIG